MTAVNPELADVLRRIAEDIDNPQALQAGRMFELRDLGFLDVEPPRKASTGCVERRAEQWPCTRPEASRWLRCGRRGLEIAIKTGFLDAFTNDQEPNAQLRDLAISLCAVRATTTMASRSACSTAGARRVLLVDRQDGDRAVVLERLAPAVGDVL